MDHILLLKKTNFETNKYYKVDVSEKSRLHIKKGTNNIVFNDIAISESEDIELVYLFKVNEKISGGGWHPYISKLKIEFTPNSNFNSDYYWLTRDDDDSYPSITSNWHKKVLACSESVDYHFIDLMSNEEIIYYINTYNAN